ncbi:MAG: HD domain-containing protein [Saprospiraceae bacterium]|nr:HD domain-containing protein [Saprospiraceae bacterium]
MNIRKLKSFITSKLKQELPKQLTYHGLHHTLDVLNVCNLYIKRLNIPAKDAYLLRTASLIHDVGIIWTYNGHEEASVVYAEEILPAMGYSKKDIERISKMIMATNIPQSPKNILEQIICDADLDYLGRSDVYPISQTLYKEFLAYKVVKDEESWDRLQVNFLTKHFYHTEFAKKYRAPKKEIYLQEIKKKWAWE